jgi:hypothetical protein
MTKDNFLYTGTPKLIKSPVYVGYYELGGQYGIRIAFEKKPNWFHRTMMKLCLGWSWSNGSF